jgi:hypothetical protein
MSSLNIYNGNEPSKKMKRFLILSLFFFGITVATTGYVYPMAVTYLDQNDPSANYGTSSVGYLTRDESYPYPFYDLLFMVNISVVPSNFTGFTCYFTQVGVNEDEITGPWIPLDYYSVSSNWTESTVTYATYPPVLTKFLTEYVDDNDNMIIIPMTTPVQNAKLAGATKFSVAGRSPYPIKPFSFWTDNAALQYRPYCLADY